MPAPGVTTEVLLRVIDITLADAGTYTCTANGGMETGDVMKSKITVISKFEIFLCLFDINTYFIHFNGIFNFDVHFTTLFCSINASFYHLFYHLIAA